MAKRKVRVRRERKRRLKKTVKFLFFLIVVGLLCLFYKDSKLFSKPVRHIKEIKKEIAKENYPKEYNARLFMVGDALIHNTVYEDAELDDGNYNFKPMLELIKPISKKYNLAYYNQETILGGPELGYSSYPRFNSPYEVGDAFIDAGFNLVSLANNHTMDKGEKGVINSVAYWKSKKDKVVYTGQWTSFEEREKESSYIHEINGIKYAFFSYTTWNNGLKTPVGKEYLNNEYSDEKAAEDIAKVRDNVDVIIVAMHWGIEYSYDVSGEQERIAYYLSNLGVNLIIGTHPHVVEPVEYINDNKTFVIYSLGNFISDQEGNARLTGLMMDLNLKKIVNEDKTVDIMIENPKAELIYTKSYNKNKRNFKVYPYVQLNDNLLHNYESLYEKYKAIVSSRYSELEWGVTGE